MLHWLFEVSSRAVLFTTEGQRDKGDDRMVEAHDAARPLGKLSSVRFIPSFALLGLTFCVLLGALLGVVSGCSSSPDRPAVVLLLTVDTLRPDYLGFFGYDRESSPFLDSLLEESQVFEQAMTPIARTTPALASLLTGLYPHRHGVRQLFQRLPEKARTLADIATDAGYTTLAVVSNHILTPERGLDQGFAVYDFADDAREAGATTRAALSLLESHADAERIFIWVHYIDPHVPYAPPERHAKAMDPEYTGRFKLQFGGAPGTTGTDTYPRELGKVRSVFRNDLPDAQNAHIRRLYAADIRQTDDAIAALFAGIDAARGEGWLAIFTADHGEALGEHDYFYDHGDDVYQPSLLVPLAFRFPKDSAQSGGKRIRDPVSLVDVAPTLAEILGVSLELAGGELIDGRSLMPRMRGETLPPQSVFAETGRAFFPKELEGRDLFGIQGRVRTVIDQDWKLIWTPGATGAGTYELYSLSSDPIETRNVYHPEHPEAARLQAILRGWMTRR